ncbi:DUF4961 domain-containing protein [uncultured Algibacter sp.]|uniref:DUF4961 domain-containing protein n=1 Tax=uncultured Algibacter sp. TaxID=298659 RepID=UPI0030ED1432|tara:strand:- start:1579 stop:2445 length:867 start_codon:yes stop_codon:yes gene_type:complete
MKKITFKLTKQRVAKVFLLFSFLLLTMCVTINSINEPPNITAGSTIDVTINTTILGEVDDAGQWLYVAFLAPAAWDLENNGNLTGTYEFTSDVTMVQSMGTLALPPMDDPGPQNPPTAGQTWEESCNAAFGFASNTPGDVKWVVLRSEGAKIPVANTEELAGSITLTINVGAAAVTTELGYGVLIGNYDFENSDRWDLEFTGVKGITLSTEEVASIDAHFHPNPFNNTLSIDSQTALKKVEFYSITGQKIKEISSNFKTISTDDLSNGFYIVKVLSDKGSITKKLIKK